MLNNKYYLNFGIIVLVFTIVLSALFIKWVLAPMNYEQVIVLEQKAYSLLKEGKEKEALRYFFKLIEFDNNKIKNSNRYEVIAKLSSEPSTKIKYLKIAYELNKSKSFILDELQALMNYRDFKIFQDNKNSIFYVNRYNGGWSKGKKSYATIDVKKDYKYTYRLSFSTNNPKKEFYNVRFFINNKNTKNFKISKDKWYTYDFLLKKGIYKISIDINETFNPKELKMSLDNRELGVNYKFEEVGVQLNE